MHPLKKIEITAYRKYVRLLRFLDHLFHPLDWLPFESPDISKSNKLVFSEANFSVHMVLCHRDVEMALWCLKSFSHFAEISPPIMIHDDGTLTADDKKTLRRHLHHCTIVQKAEADARMHEILRDFPNCRRIRARPGFHCARKLFDPPVYATGEVMLLLDSDILFFRRPSELLDCAGRGRPCFNSDYQNAYSASIEDLSRALKIDMFPRVNAGMVILPKKLCDFSFMEEYFGIFSEPIKFINVHEQTLNAALLSRACARRLSDVYQISRTRLRPETVSHHFVNDGSRKLFYPRGIRTLLRRGAIPANYSQ